MTSTENKHVTGSFAFLLLLLSFTGLSQNYGNEWIDYGRRYFKIPVYKESVYRIDSATLATAFDLGVTDPRNLQVFFKGQEQFVYIHGESDGTFNSGDYLEFYANSMTSHLDSLLYHDIRYVPNPWQSIFSDTVHAFISSGTTPSTKRYQTENDTTFGAYPAAQYFYTEKLRAFRDLYNTSDAFDEYTSDPRYTQSEGYGTSISKGGHAFHAFQGTNVYTATPLPVYHTVAFTGNSRQLGTNYDHQLQVSYTDNTGNSHILTDTTLVGFAPVRKQYVLGNVNLSGASDFSVSSLASPSFSAFSNNTVLHYFHTLYPNGLSLQSPQSLKFYADNHPSASKSTFSFWSFNMNNSPTAALYDLTDGKRITTHYSGGYLNAVIPDGSGWRTFYMISDSSVQKVKSLRPAGEDGYFTDYRSGISANPYLMIYHKTLLSSAQEYKSYRESGAGGSYQVVFGDIEQLYDQYAQGAGRHPAAIRNFLRHMQNSLPGQPRYILLIGSATTPNIFPTSHPLNLIPTMGRPNSDNLLSASLSTPGQFAFHPDIPIGRIAAINNSEVTIYLNKVQSHEASGQAEWKKNVLHFIGGDTEGLSLQLGSFMRTYEDIIEDTLYGGQVRTFRKNSSQPIQVVLSDSIKDMVNNGAGLLTFFGHGSPFGFDQAIDEPELYSNKDKYPFLYANSCYSGDIHDPTAQTVSKKFVFAKDKGSIGFLATTSLGFIYALSDYAGYFYRNLSSVRYNQGIGDVIKHTAFQNSFSGKNEISFTGLDMTLHGDPAVRISAGQLPDYTVADKDVRFEVGTGNDSIAIAIAYRNVGKAIRDTITISVERLFPSGDTSRNYFQVPTPFFHDTLFVKVTRGGSKGIGLNYFSIKVDQLNEVTESNESNNQTGSPLEVFIPGNDVVPVYPYDFSVVPSTPAITLKASTIDAYAPLAGYRFELDTCNCFTAPVASTLVTGRGGVIEWPVNLPGGDSTVYYWRVTRDSVTPDDRISWRQSTFQTVTDKRGWGQAHFQQFANNATQLVTYKEDQRQFIFENRLNTINTRAGFHPYVNDGQQTYYFNNTRMDSWSCTFNGWNFAVFDSISGEPQKAVNPNWPGHSEGSFGNCVCDKGLPHQYLYYFGRTNECTPNDLNWKTKMENFLTAIPPNSYVLGFTTGNPAGNAEMSTYSEPLYQAFESIGSGAIRTSPDTVAMVIFGKKGMSAGQAKERVGDSKRTVLFTQDSIRTKWNSGYITSPVIGPSYKWQSLHWRVKSLEGSAGDTTIVKVIGIRSDGTMDTLRTLSEDSTDVLGIDAFIDAATYPFIKLVAYMRDVTHLTSPQLKSWHVLYDEAPECALNPPRLAAVPKDSLQEGEKTSYYFPIENIGARNFDDSLVITYWIEDAQRVMNPLSEKRKVAPFTAGQIIIDTVNIDSYELRGNNALWISINPPDHPRYQREQHYFNNVARVPFQVAADQKNPLLDVTFDGRRILNGDIVSAKPVILVTLKDENKFLALNDTSAFSISLRAPSQQAPRRIYFGQGLQFTPAQLPRNSASILYTPELPEDGKYTLIVQARDRSSNKSGANDFVADFEVKNKPSITNVLNYPNPFTTSTRFIFTLTGSQIPEVFTIQVLTITGKVVREITRTELGVLRIGRNITDYAWDGRDQYGDRLANGVYLYRVRTKLNGNDVEKLSSGADKFFNREYGKMVLMR